MAIGPGPVLAYARHVERVLGAARGFELRVAAEIVTAEERGAYPVSVLDGYDLVRQHALAAGATDEQIELAYRASRSQLGSGQAPVAVPRGIAALLEELRGRVRVALVTNAPATGLDGVLDALGLGGGFHEVHASAGKPAGLRELAAAWLAEGRVLSIGDIWVNDLEPVHALGGDTALVGSPPDGATPTFAGQNLPALYPDIRRWASSAPDHDLPSSHPATSNETEPTR
ncbi:hypothetical protein GCM10010921_02140 [Microbacterium album]|uniref:Hydrolase n=1 Tax=Microbacterium album TaxID=2053191 RepID=A0A917ICI9_9MICO|nr:HAD family hydrolase [Microbacterium album]GGH34434.1 hypothetical protein GCM10010921_02140 [Microbacterium album]